MAEPAKLPLSLVIITLNEEKNLKRALSEAAVFDDIIVLDSGSQDRTAEIARAAGARFEAEPWKGFGAQKHRAVSLAKNDWVFCLDADEVISADLVREVRQKFPELNPSVAYKIPRKSFYLGRWIMHGGWYPDFQVRLFHRKHYQWNSAEIHESVQALQTLQGVSQNHALASALEHYVFQDIDHQVATNNRYSSLQADQHLRRGRRFSLGKMLVKPATKFLECYFWKRGFMDGLPGFIIAVGAAYSVFLRWAKIWQKESL